MGLKVKGSKRSTLCYFHFILREYESSVDLSREKHYLQPAIKCTAVPKVGLSSAIYWRCL